MGWLSRIFGGKAPKPKNPEPQLSPAYSEQARQAANRFAQEVAEDVAYRILTEAPKTEEETFLEMGGWHSVASSNLSSISYNKDAAELHVEYKDGSYYGYGPIDYSAARSLWHSPSKGKWVWDNLRVRGTVFGYQVPYWFLSGPSANKAGSTESVRNWMRTAESRLRHGQIGPAGE